MIEAALSGVAEFVSAQQLHALLGADAPSLATVYRTLQSLERSGQIDTVNRNGEAVYRACAPTHHHHLVCTVCSTTIEVAGDEVERWASQTATEHGFALQTHVADIYGTCVACST